MKTTTTETWLLFLYWVLSIKSQLQINFEAAGSSVCYFHRAQVSTLDLISQRGGKHAGLFPVSVVLTRSAETERL